MNRLRLASVLIATTQFVARAQGIHTDVVIKSPDGVALHGTVFSPSTPGPGIVLFHQCNMDRHAWDGLASDLVSAGIRVLTFDSRGYGQSGRGRSMPDNIAGDGDAAYSWLAAQNGVKGIAAGGASCGVAQAVNLASRHRDIKALVLLSGGVPPIGIKFIGATATLAVLAAASQRDGLGVIVADAERASMNPQSIVKLYPGSAHGVDMFKSNTDLRPLIVRWLRDRMAQ